MWYCKPMGTSICQRTYEKAIMCYYFSPHCVFRCSYTLKGLVLSCSTALFTTWYVKVCLYTEEHFTKRTKPSIVCAARTRWILLDQSEDEKSKRGKWGNVQDWSRVNQSGPSPPKRSARKTSVRPTLKWGFSLDQPEGEKGGRGEWGNPQDRIGQGMISRHI